jgi:poly(beta-D-mannuronate) lyase
MDTMSGRWIAILAALAVSCASGPRTGGEATGGGGDETGGDTGGAPATGGTTGGGGGRDGAGTGGAKAGGTGGDGSEADAGREDAAPAGMDSGAGGSGGGGPDGGAAPGVACTRRVPVTDTAGLATALGAAKPGDCLEVGDGQYTLPTISAQGTEAAPIVIKARNRLKASSTGIVTFSGAAWVTVEGFAVPGARMTNTKHCRLTRAAVSIGGGLSVDGDGDGNRIDHCDIGGGSSAGDIVHPGGLSTNTLIDHNHFHDLHAPHTITMGCCGATYDYHDTGDVAEYNLFVNCMSGAELFSVKSSASTIRYNTVRNCAGDIDIRAGRHDSIYGNFVFNSGNFGIRMYEDDHRIYNNYIESARAIAVGPWHDGHAQVKNATIVFNTFVGRVSLGDDVNTNFSNNIVIGPITTSMGLGGTMPIMPTYKNNILASGTPPAGGGFLVTDPKLVRMGELLTITAGSPAVGAGSAVPFVTDDMAGTARGSKPDIGAQQLSSSPGPRRPLTKADVGPDAP